MKIHLTGDCSKISKGLEEISDKLGVDLSEEGYEIKVSQNTESMLSVVGNEYGYSISYNIPADFYRAFAIMIHKLKNSESKFEIIEKRAFKSNGAMLDLSRNAVLKVDALKRFIRYLALMGHNTLYLYMEDTYKLDDYEYFGYMRGAYTGDELKEVVSYADKFSIEIIPCIQTLGHLAKTLKWNYAADFKDTDAILLIDEPKTYEFIEAMFKLCKECFTTDKIHVGLDEAHAVGTGAYLKKFGPCGRFELMSKHMKRVSEIADKYELKPMMWSDMFFRIGSHNGNEYYDPNSKMPSNLTELIPENMSQVYWDYYNENEGLCQAMIEAHQKMERPVIFAGGIWIWGSLVPNYHKSFNQSKCALKLCRKNNIQDVFATLWGDDGAECNVFTSLLGLQLFSEYSFYDDVSDEHLAEMFKICTGCDMSAFMLLGLDGMLKNEISENLPDWRKSTQTTKQLLFQDILLGLFDENYRKMDMAEVYTDTYNKLLNSAHQGDMEYLFVYQRQLVKTLIKKWDIGVRLQKAYLKNDMEMLKALASEIAVIKEDMQHTHRLLSENWLYDNKPFGLDVIDLRFGGVIARCERAYKRVKDYINGKTDKLEELEETRLMYNNAFVKEGEPLVHECSFSRISTVQ